MNHLKECFGFIPLKELWEFLCSDGVELIVILGIAVGIMAGLLLTLIERGVFNVN